MALTILAIVLFQGLIFVGLVVMLRHFMKGNVKGQLSHLDKLNQELVKREAELKKKLEMADQEYASRIAKLEQETVQRQTQARQEVSKMLEENRGQAMKEREKIIGEAVTTRDKIRNEIMAEMENKAIDYARILMAEFFTGELKKKLHDELLQRLIYGILAVDLTRYEIHSDTVELKVAETLSEDEKNRILSVLKGKMNKELQFKEQIDPSLIGGAVLISGSFVIDGSMDNLLKEAGARLKKETHRRYQGAV